MFPKLEPLGCPKKVNHDGKRNWPTRLAIAFSFIPMQASVATIYPKFTAYSFSMDAYLFWRESGY